MNNLGITEVTYFWSADEYPYFNWGTKEECISHGGTTGFSLSYEYAENFINRLGELKIQNKKYLDMVQRESMNELSKTLTYYLENKL